MSRPRMTATARRCRASTATTRTTRPTSPPIDRRSAGRQACRAVTAARCACRSATPWLSSATMASTGKRLAAVATTLSFEKFWAWLAGHANCIVRAGTPEVVLLDHDDFHWTLITEDDHTLVVQLARAKELVGELLVFPAEIAYVQVEPSETDGEFLARFERETRVMSKLNHPNCVSVVDFGVWDGAPYLVMEYVSGTTLRALIDNGALPVRRALALIRQIGAGLAHAHAQGVVHRDIKPANIMVSEEIGTGDHVRILDFGLARLRGAVGRDATQSNVVVGTPNYMAPEQTVGGGLIDARTDIYAAGVVLFELVCGDRPFQAEDTLALLGMHRAAPIPKLADRAKGINIPA